MLRVIPDTASTTIAVDTAPSGALIWINTNDLVCRLDCAQSVVRELRQRLRDEGLFYDDKGNEVSHLAWKL